VREKGGKERELRTVERAIEDNLRVSERGGGTREHVASIKVSS
jgi:hypothetical protein